MRGIKQHSTKHWKHSLLQALDGMKNNIATDLLTIEIRSALMSLSEITGDISTEDLLENIFSRFCIGK
jgi:tRNA modification GTPase